MFRALFERAVNAVWDGFAELSETHRELAGILARDANVGITSLVQATAFGLACIDERLNDDGQAMIRALVALAMPECLRPRPAMTILALPPARIKVASAWRAKFDASSKDAGFPLSFELRSFVTPGPYELTEVCVERPSATLQTLQLTLAGRDGAVIGNVLPERVRFFVFIEPANAALEVIHALRIARDPIVFETFDVNGARLEQGQLPRSAFSWVRVDTDDEPPLVDAPEGRFRASVLLEDLFAFPEGHSFFEVRTTSFRSERVARIELTLPFGYVVGHAAAMRNSNVRLFCAPAVNAYHVPIMPLRAAQGPDWLLLPAERPRAEVLHVRTMQAEGQPGPVPLESFEAPEQPHTLESGRFYYRLSQKIARDGSRTEMRLSLATRESFRVRAPRPVIQGTVLASDGMLAQTIGVGEIGRTDIGQNISRVAPSRRAVLDRRLPMRMNAFGRMSAHRFAHQAHLDAFVGMHKDCVPDGAVRAPRFLAMTHQLERRGLSGGGSQQVDHFDVQIDKTACSDAEAFVVCHHVSRAVAERNDLMRASRLTASCQKGRREEIFAEYDARDGERLSFPLG
ncbi:type VI secretion system baseplate subunit TssF [Pendulispora brunnea]|uniref:Type VI secretion system baseplate subunit TssF n=1 Tax=Pendulispora brunnea TaxID=2905690 RepID=A0ABZ2KDS3_9BACT